jgi:hypothetical protein
MRNPFRELGSWVAVLAVMCVGVSVFFGCGKAESDTGADQCSSQDSQSACIGVTDCVWTGTACNAQGEASAEEEDEQAEKEGADEEGADKTPPSSPPPPPPPKEEGGEGACVDLQKGLDAATTASSISVSIKAEAAAVTQQFYTASNVDQAATYISQFLEVVEPLEVQLLANISMAEELGSGCGDLFTDQFGSAQASADEATALMMTLRGNMCYFFGYSESESSCYYGGTDKQCTDQKYEYPKCLSSMCCGTEADDRCVSLSNSTNKYRTSCKQDQVGQECRGYHQGADVECTEIQTNAGPDYCCEEIDICSDPTGLSTGALALREFLKSDACATEDYLFVDLFSDASKIVCSASGAQIVTAALNKDDFAAESLWTCLPSSASSSPLIIYIWNVTKTQTDTQILPGRLLDFVPIDFALYYLKFRRQDLSGTVQFRPDPTFFGLRVYTSSDGDDVRTYPFSGLTVQTTDYVSVDHVFACDATTGGKECWPRLFDCDSIGADTNRQCGFACTDDVFAATFSYLCS